MIPTKTTKAKDVWKRRAALGSCGLLFFALCMFHIVTKEGGDTIIFRQYVSQWGFFEFLSHRFHTFTGRIIWEGVLYLILKAPAWVFSWMNIALILGGVALCKYLMEWDFWETGIFALLLLLFPINGLVEVGIQPGFINYVWALVLSLAALVPLKMVQKGSSVSWYHYFLFGAAALAGGNMEQMAAIVTSFYLVFLVYFGQTKKLCPILFVQLAIGVASFLFLQTCQGNAMRMEAEILSKWPGFSELSMGEKIWNGWNTTVNHLYSIPNEPVLIFSSTLYLWLRVKGKRSIYSFLAGGVVLWLILVWGVKILEILFDSGLQEKMNGILVLRDEQGRMTASPVPVAPFLFWYSVLALATMAAVAGSFSNWKEAGFYLLILGAGFASRMVMGFSPTLIASNIRTFLFFHFSLYLAAMHYIHQIRLIGGRDAFQVGAKCVF
ncbi:hypothetical protein VSQ48_09940 [Candidatus Ventrimonas sp. KK005]